jgi:outer membrane protein OmpA-like peptidoglycan-associated protein
MSATPDPADALVAELGAPACPAPAPTSAELERNGVPAPTDAAPPDDSVSVRTEASPMPPAEDLTWGPPLLPEPSAGPAIEQQRAAPDDGAPAAPPVPLVHVARAARLSRGPWLPLVTDGTAPGDDERASVFAAASDLGPGEIAYMRVSARWWPGYHAAVADVIERLRRGKRPRRLRLPASTRALGRVAAWTVRRLRTEAQMSGSGTDRTGACVRTQAQAVELADVQRKAAAPEHYAVSVHVGVGAMTKPRAVLLTTAMTHALTQAYTAPHQALAWSGTHPLRALTRQMPVRATAPPVALTSGELGRLARVPDGSLRPHGVRVRRSSFTSVPLAAPVRIDDPLSPPPGLIPMGIQDPDGIDAVSIGMRNKDLSMHALITGETGSGKSVHLVRLAYGIACDDSALIVLDPHGELSDNIMSAVIRHAPHRADDIVLVDLVRTPTLVYTAPTEVSANGALPSSTTFACRLDGGSWQPCGAGRDRAGREYLPRMTTPELAPGEHTFAVRATDWATNTDGTPATRTFRVVAPVTPPVDPPTTPEEPPTPTTPEPPTNPEEPTPTTPEEPTPPTPDPPAKPKLGPEAVARATRTAGTVAGFRIDGSPSRDRDGGRIVRYRWVDRATGKVVSTRKAFPFSATRLKSPATAYRWRLTVWDDDGLADSADVIVRASKRVERTVERFSGDALYYSDSAQLRPDGLRELQKIRKKVQGATSYTVAAHASSEGSIPYNQRLSARRARAMITYIQRGNRRAPKRHSARGYGESRPIVSNRTESGRKLNRRAEVTIVREVVRYDVDVDAHVGKPRR